MSDEGLPKPRWQSIVETLAMAGIAIAIISQGVFPRRVAAEPVAPLPKATVRPPKPPEPPPPTDPISLEGAALQGQKTAKVALIVYSDFQCPYCGKFERETLPGIQNRYVKSGQVLLAFRQFPLGMHPFAQKAAESTECAGQQGKFWEMHDQLFQHQQQLDEASLRGYAQAIGIKKTPFDACLAGQTADKVKQDAAQGQSFRVSGTPTFFVGLVQPDGRVKVLKRLSGALPIGQFQVVLDDVLGSAPTGATVK